MRLLPIILSAGALFCVDSFARANRLQLGPTIDNEKAVQSRHSLGPQIVNEKAVQSRHNLGASVSTENLQSKIDVNVQVQDTQRPDLQSEEILDLNQK